MKISKLYTVFLLLTFVTTLFFAEDKKYDEWKKKHVENLEAFDLKNFEEAKLSLESAYKIANDIFTEENVSNEIDNYFL